MCDTVMLVQLTLTSFYRRQDVKAYNFSRRVPPYACLVGPAEAGSKHFPCCTWSPQCTCCCAHFHGFVSVGMQRRTPQSADQYAQFTSACRLVSMLPYKTRVHVVMTVFNDVIERVPLLRDHRDDAPFLIEILSRCTRTRFSAAALKRMRQEGLPSEHVSTSSTSACLFAAGTFESDIYIVTRYVTLRARCSGVARFEPKFCVCTQFCKQQLDM